MVNLEFCPDPPKFCINLMIHVLFLRNVRNFKKFMFMNVF